MVLAKNKIFIGVVIFLFVLVGLVGSFVYFNDRFNQPNSEDTQQVQEDALDEQAQLTDVQYPSVEETKKQYSSSDEQFAILVSQAQGKQYIGKYDEALVYYEAALESGFSNEEQLTLVRYAVYLMAIEWGNEAIKQKYEQILGADTIKKIKQEAEERDTNR